MSQLPLRFVHVGFHPTGPVPVKKIEGVFSSATDWLRYDPHCWIMYTSTALSVWRDRLHKVPEIMAGEFFLCEFDAHNASAFDGYMDQSTWDWINKRLT